MAAMIQNKKSVGEIEALIERQFEADSQIYDLDTYDINQIRRELFLANGWTFDPYPLEDEDEEDDADSMDWYCKPCKSYMSDEAELNEVGMSMRDFL